MVSCEATVPTSSPQMRQSPGRPVYSVVAIGPSALIVMRDNLASGRSIANDDSGNDLAYQCQRAESGRRDRGEGHAQVDQADQRRLFRQSWQKKKRPIYATGVAHTVPDGQ